MNIEDFRRIVLAFADREADLDLAQGNLLVQVHDELIEAKITQRSGDLYVEEGGESLSATTWVIHRLARLPLLADRILAHWPQPQNFVTPSGLLLDQIEQAPLGSEVPLDNAADCVLQVLGRRPAGASSVFYLTSDAGEGKTTLIGHVARLQATRYKAKQADWLLVPIPLGGRTLLRFDDVVVAALVNRLRFQFFYYEAFLELVRLGVLVPAFDGFEEMIIESSSGEAISALGNLVRSLHSSGALLVAARKAYFDYQSFRTQARLFDAIRGHSVMFGRVSLNRWSDRQFLTYAELRGLPSSSEVYSAVAGRLGAAHPLLTRAVLVRRLVDVALALKGDLSALLESIGNQPQDYFFQFVNALIEREAHEKWVDQSGDPAQPLLTIDEHHELLAALAQEMWYSSVDALRSDVVGLVADLFLETRGKPLGIARQIRERLKQHCLLVAIGSGQGGLAFDHEDFRVFFLGEALGRAIAKKEKGELRAVLSVASLPFGAVDEAVRFLRRKDFDARGLLSLLQELSDRELPTSFVRDNAGALAMQALSGWISGAAEMRGATMPPDALRARTVSAVTFMKCYFPPTSLVDSHINDCVFVECRFERLEGLGACVATAVFQDCEVGSVRRDGEEIELFDPAHIAAELDAAGIRSVTGSQQQLPFVKGKIDEELRLIERTLRLFLRSTHANESVIRTKLGVKANLFLGDILPELLRLGVLIEVPYLGSGAQRRFKVGIQMNKVQEALKSCNGQYATFLKLCAG